MKTANQLGLVLDRAEIPEWASRFRRGVEAARRERGVVGGMRAKGLRVIPLRPNGKTPTVTGWQTNGIDYLIGPKQNYGVDCGFHFDGRSLLVVDLDEKDGRHGIKAWQDLVAGRDVPETFGVETPTGGRHLYFVSPTPVSNSAGKLAEGIDIRSKGGYVVGPGSTIDGKAYAVRRDVPIADAPQWLIELCGQSRERDPHAGEPMPGLDRVPAESLRARVIHYLEHDAPRAIENEGGDATTIAVANRCGDMGVDEKTALELMADHWNERNEPPWPLEILTGEKGLETKVANAYRYRTDPIGCDVPQLLFDPVPESGKLLQLVSVTDILNATIKTPQFVVDGIIPESEVTLLGGHGGSGKSLLALVLAAHVAAGVDWHGLHVRQGPALYLSLEDRGELIRYRLRRIVRAYGLDPRAVEPRLRIFDGREAGALMEERSAWSGTVAETKALTELRDEIRDAAFVVIDNASDAFDGNENSRRQVRTFVRTLQKLGSDNNAAVLLLAHIDKSAARFGSNGNTYSGSTAWHNSVRSRLALLHDDRKGLHLDHEKVNEGTLHDPLPLMWEDSVPMPRHDGDSTSTVAADNAAHVLAAIKAAIGMGRDVGTAVTGPATTQRTLDTIPGFPAWLRGPKGRDAFWEAIATLQQSGQIAAEEYMGRDRHKRQRFVVAGVCGSSAGV